MTAATRLLYLDLIKKTLTCTVYEGLDGSLWIPKNRLQRLLVGLVVPTEVRLSQAADINQRREGREWPVLAQTMIGLNRLDHLQYCVERVLTDDVSGDLIEAGVWRGGATIFMRALLKAYGVADRCVWVADSFAGLPPPDAAEYPADAGDCLFREKSLAVSLEQVRANFERYNLLDDQVRFLRGWFKDVLPAAPIDKLAVIRLDGDMYESTVDSLTHLYPKLQPGGFLVVDDYGAVPGCRQAVHDYRLQHGITEEIERIDWTGAFWRRSR
ncbi:MAG: class I SAM-dependent methyltransferase [Acidobacteria bacterium]|nr:class I SAM-dependent methyltransferase [Acidobacteriota bacterium]